MAMFSVSMSTGIPAHSEVGVVVSSWRSRSRPAGFSSSTTTSILSRTGFFGCARVLQCAPLQNTLNLKRLVSPRAVVKRRKDAAFDNVIQRDKKVRIVSKIRSILVKQPNRTMSLLQLGKYRREIGLMGKRRVVSLLNKYPAVFEVYEDGCGMMFVRFTLEAESQYETEKNLQDEHEASHVEKLRKMLMMSVDKRLNLDKIAHFRQDLGLPDDFRTNLCTRYPEFFKVVDAETGPSLELTSWDPLLAVSFAEKKAAADAGRIDDKPRIIIDGEEIVSTALSNRRLNLPKGLSLTKKDRQTALKFMNLPYISPYSDATGLNPASIEAEKRVAGTVHELLSLTLEKKTLIDHLTHFKKDYKFSQRIHSMLIRHPEMFYVSFRGHRDSVFLREAWERSELLEKDRLIIAKDRLRELVAVRSAAPRDRRRSPRAAASEDTDGYYKNEDFDSEDENFDSEDEDFDNEDYDEDDDNYESDEEGVSETEEFDDAHVEAIPAAGRAQSKARPYAPSPRKPVKTIKDLPPRPGDEVFEKSAFVRSMENTPRERW